MKLDPETERAVLATPGVRVYGCKPVTPPGPDAARKDEKAFMSAVVKEARRRGWEEYHTFDSRKSRRGFPDLVLVRPPRVVFAECKTEAGKLTPDQMRWRDMLGVCPGVQVFLWRPGDWQDILRELG